MDRQKAIELLTDRLPVGATIAIQRIDFGRKATKHAYAILVISDGRIENISGMVAKAIEWQWVNSQWPSASGVWARNAADVHEALAFALHGHKPASVLGKLLKYEEL